MLICVDGSDMIRLCSRFVSIALEWNHRFSKVRNMAICSFGNFRNGNRHSFHFFCMFDEFDFRMREPWSAIKVGSDAWKNTTEGGTNATHRR